MTIGIHCYRLLVKMYSRVWIQDMELNVAYCSLLPLCTLNKILMHIVAGKTEVNLACETSVQKV